MRKFTLRPNTPLKTVRPPTNDFWLFFPPKIPLFLINLLIKHRYLIRDKEGYINFFLKKPPFPKKLSNELQEQFLQFPQKTLLFLKKIIEHENI